MKFYSSRKWRKYFRSISLRASFTIVLMVVVMNSLMYIAWQKYYQTPFSSLVISSIKVENSKIQNEVVNITKSWDDHRTLSYLHKYLISFSNTTYGPCPKVSKKTVGRFIPDLVVHNWTVLEAMHPHLDYGHWGPQCLSSQRVAIIIPYRNRETHLQVLVNNLHNMLARQEIEYGIFVVEQLPGTNFNRALLFNIGFVEALKWHNFNCFVFHDVDLIPENDHNFYTCGSNPKHLSAYIDKFSYKLPYQDLFGGVSAISIDQLRHINGFSNLYFGWGGEDDDMSKRLRHHGYQIYRYPKMIGSYKMIKHVSDNGNDANVWRFSLVRSALQRMHKDGLNNVEYDLKEIQLSPLMIWLKIDVDENKIRQNYSNYINQTFFDTSIDNQIKVVAIMLFFFLGSLLAICGLIACTINMSPDSSQTLKSNKASPIVLSDTKIIK